MKILHFSDPHFDLSLRSLPLRKWFGKRAIGALNLLAGRGRAFDEAEPKIAALNAFKNDNDIDLVLCTGDYTALGLEAELRDAALLIKPLQDAPLGYMTVPGNHDIYAKDVIRNSYFLNNFGTSMQTDLPEYCVDGVWPLVRLMGDDIAVVAVNSAKPNPVPWRSDGHIPTVQLEALGRILDDPRLQGRFVFVMTHYAARLANGQPDSRLHGLHNADEFLDVCRKVTKGALLCGHIHHRYEVALEGLSAKLYCAGSATKARHEGFWLFDMDAGQCHVRGGFYDADKQAYALEDTA